MDSNHQETFETVAFNAVSTVPNSDSSQYNEFLSYLGENKLTSIGRIHGYPVYHFDDYLGEKRCYLFDERSGVPEGTLSLIHI